MLKESSLKKIWLLAFCVLVILMISVGGVTRLTRSGLSIVEWKPISGIIPPITEQDWQEQFELYKSSPEFNKVNSHFELSDYKNIFMWEYLHRVLGRIIFLFVVLPGFILWRKKIVSGKLVVLLALAVASQGLIGWLMVKSGLNKDPHVSPYMLALHFFSALGVLLIGFYSLSKVRPAIQADLNKSEKRQIKLFGSLLAVQIFYGCLTSGLKAGYGYNTYPLMNGEFFPRDGLFFYPAWINFFENTAAVQWTHRWIGILVLLSSIALVFRLMKNKTWPSLKKPVLLLLAVVCLQILLGILNIIYVVPISLAAIHQLVAGLLVLAYFNIVFRISDYPR